VLPESIGRYRVDSVLGAGTFATVYRAWDDALDVPVAIKVLAQNWSFDPDIRRRFITEAQLLRRAQGTRVVRVHDIGETTEGQPYFVIDYADRGTVENRLERLRAEGTALEVPDVLRFSRALAAGVAEVHRLGVVHRDLKPSNLLLRELPGAVPGDGVGGAIVGLDEQLAVSDLGFAREVDATRLTAAVGTEGYMAPEQRDPAAPIDTRADIYACTAILEHVLGEPLPDELAARGLADDPAERYSTIDSWLERVEVALTQPAGAAPRKATAKRRRRGPLVALGAFAAIAALIAVVAVVFVLGGDDDDGGQTTGTAGTTPVAVVPGVDPIAVNDAVLVDPLDVAVGPDGAVYIDEFRANRVRRLGDDGNLATVAGTGAPGREGDGGPAVDAQLFLPTGIGIGNDGSVYIADSFNGLVRRVDAKGTMTTVAGSGGEGDVIENVAAVDAAISPRDVAAGPDGTVYIADAYNSRVWIVKDGQIRTHARMQSPNSAAIAPDGSLYVSDAIEHTVTRIDNRGLPTVVAGSGRAGFSGDGGPATKARLDGPDGLAIGGDGALYIADTANQRVRRVDAGGTITTIAGNGKRGPDGDGGPATDAALADPASVAIDTNGRVLIVDGYGNRVRVVGDGTIDTLVGAGEPGAGGDNGPAVAAAISDPHGIAFDGAGNLYIAEGLTGKIRRVDAGTDEITTVAGLATTSGDDGGDGGPALAAAFSGPDGVAIDGAGIVFVADFVDARIRAFQVGKNIVTLAGTGVAGYSGDGGPAQSAQIDTPLGVTIAPDGSLVLADGGNQRVRRVAGNDGRISTIAGSGLPGRGSPRGKATDARLNLPYGVAVGRDGAVYVAEKVGDRVRRIDPDGTIATFAGTGRAGFSGDSGPATRARINEPAGIAVDADGRVFIAERSGHRIRRVDRDGTIVTVAGTGVAGFGGDGGDASAAQLARPTYLALGRDGALYVSDSGNNRIRRIDLEAGTIETVAGAF
jgi:sugar lactone lactonase YvrE